jgi:hypothetical protein
MSLYQIALGVHTLVAVLGIGQVLALVVLAGEARAGSSGLPVSLSLMGKLARIVGISLGLQLLSGLAVMIPTRGAYAAAWWFRIAFLLFIVLGALNGMLQGAVRKQALARLPTLAWTMVGITAVIVWLMAVKPF